MHPVIELKKITKTYRMGDISVLAVRGVSLTVEKREFLAVMGASGSGKSTMMNIIGCLDTPTSGDYFLEGVHVNTLSRDEYADIRNRKIGFVFQGFNLLSRTSAVDNVELPLLYNRSGTVRNPEQRSIQALEKVGLGDRLHHEPNRLSGGQQQRVAIARALVNEPSLILADEPTGNLDTRTSLEIMALFQELNRQGITILLVTHENDIARYSRRIIEMRDGMIIRDAPVQDSRDARKDMQALAETAPDVRNQG
ncbi:MAG: ABC transporter ATP-binding protein [Candidatus Latescibacterota bacterium]